MARDETELARSCNVHTLTRGYFLKYFILYVDKVLVGFHIGISGVVPTRIHCLLVFLLILASNVCK